MTEYKKPLPFIDLTNKPFWEGAKRHELMAYRCLNCGTFYYPAIHCVACDNPKMEWVKVTGKGQVYTYGIFHQLYNPAFEGEIPYNVTCVKLDEGPIIISNIVECKNEDIYIGMSVEAVFEDVTEEISLPKFRPVA